MKATVLGPAAGTDHLAPRLRAFVARLGKALGDERSTLSVLLTDDAGIRDYNRRFRSKDEATDVLSFPALAGMPGESGHYLGDLVVSLERAERQARDIGHDLGDEVEVLVLHGVLHLRGLDHESDEGQMRRAEEQLARELFGGSRGLISRSESRAGRR